MNKTINLQIDRKEFIRLIKYFKGFTEKGRVFEFYNGIFITKIGTDVCMAATDGKRLVYKNISDAVRRFEFPYIYISQDYFKTLLEKLESSLLGDVVTVCRSEDNKGYGVIAISGAADSFAMHENYTSKTPDFDRVIPKETLCAFSVDAKEFKSAVKKIKAGSKKAQAFTMTFNRIGAKVTLFNKEADKSYVLPVTYANNFDATAVFTFNLDYFTDVFKWTGYGGVVSFCFDNNNNKPIKITGGADSPVHVIMPKWSGQ